MSRHVGRPPLPPGEKRSRRLHLSVTPTELKMIVAAAALEDTHPAGLGYEAIMERTRRVLADATR